MDYRAGAGAGSKWNSSTTLREIFLFDLANHLLLLDPAWNPAAEWQCFDRVHRLGQDKDVCIYKFITKVPVFIFYQGSIFYILPPYPLPGAAM